MAVWASPGNLLEMQTCWIRKGQLCLCSSRVPRAPQDAGPALWSQASSEGTPGECCGALCGLMASWCRGFRLCPPPTPCSGCGNAVSPEEQCSLLLKCALGGLWAALGCSSHGLRQRPYLEIRSLQV